MAELINEGDFAIFKDTEPKYNIREIRDFSTDLQGEIAAIELRWSFDDKTYSGWVELTTENLRNIKTDPDSPIWFEFRVTLVSGGPITINTIELEMEYRPTDKFKGLTANSFSCIETGNITAISRIEDLCFKPYDVNPAICLQDELNYMINSLLGMDVNYYRASPKKGSTDVRLFEHTLFDVAEKPVCFKVMVEDNKFPDAELSYNPFGIDFERPFEVEITKSYWDEYFGDGTGPQKRDILHFTINNRIYEVMSSTLVKGFMEKNTHWKVSLVKYNPKSNRYEPDAVRDAFDELTTDSSELFETQLREEEERETKPQQYSNFTGTIYDPSRKEINKDIVIVEKNINNYNLVIAESFYDLRNLVDFSVGEKQDIAVKYHSVVDFPVVNDFSYSSWFSAQEPRFRIPIDTIENHTFDYSSNKLQFRINKNRPYQIGDLIKIERAGNITFYGKVVNKIANDEYELEINESVIEHIESVNSMWESLSSYQATRILPVNLLNGYHNDKGVIINLIANRYFSVQLNNDEYIFPVDKNLTDDFYGLFVNVSSQFNQISVYLWQRKWIEDIVSSPETSDLFNIYNKTMNNVSIPDITNSGEWKINAGNVLLTNIRLFDKIVPFETQSIILNQNIVQDADRAIIIDNAISKFNLPFIGQTK